MKSTGMNSTSGEFLDFGGERYYAIRDSDRMAPFFVSVVSSSDHWMFISSTGGLTIGRVSPEGALFPYVSVDKVHDGYLNTGSRTLMRVRVDGSTRDWEPFNLEHDRQCSTRRNLYKSTLGDKLCFEEVNRDLDIAFRYCWETSDEFGFVRRCELENLGNSRVQVELLDGLLNILPPGTPTHTQANASNLVDAYKWSELDSRTALAMFTLYSGISDRAEPSESLTAHTVFCLGLEGHKVLLSTEQLGRFRDGGAVTQEHHTRGVRGAYLVNVGLDLAPGESRSWQIIADVGQSQGEVVALQERLERPAAVAGAIADSVTRGSKQLARIMASADGLQATAEEHVTVHHYANVLFNVLRGGIFHDQYSIPVQDLSSSIRFFNETVSERHREFFDGLSETISLPALLETVKRTDDPQLERLCYEYLPITFGRRHGDPSRPWNHFEIRLKDRNDKPLLSYQGNWRDIFQNWEALTLSYPEFVEGVVAKFVNASTMDGYNPYRITKEGIDWEVEDPEDPWSYIGYWGDHQIIYLQKMLELSDHFHPGRLQELLRRPVFSYANVPYRIKPFEALLEDPKNTVVYDYDLAERIEHRVERLGADGKLVLSGEKEVYLVNLAEKLLVPLLAKLGNLVIDGGIWLNTQRPEWNDANNALVGSGLSMVTLYYMRRYVRMLQHLLSHESAPIEMTEDVGTWLTDTAAALHRLRSELGAGRVDAARRLSSLRDLGQTAGRYREAIYGKNRFEQMTEIPVAAIRGLLDDALAAIEHSIGTNRREDGLYHAYNLISVSEESAAVDSLYPMLEGQVAVLSSGAINGEESSSLLDALFESAIYRQDQQSFMLYPDRELPGFLEKNRVPDADVQAIPLLQQMLAAGDERIISRDARDSYRFSADFRNAGDLRRALDELQEEYGEAVTESRTALTGLYEKIFNHRAFTGRSGGMFGFEGLGCIYWHMVSKLLLAVQECFFAAIDNGEADAIVSRLGRHYYRIREGLGFNKSPDEYGAFPTDPYSHTPRHAGAQQPGMTGQVKEEVLSRFGELGLRIADGRVTFETRLLRTREFVGEPRAFRYLDVHGDWQAIEVPADGLAYTWCQVPIVYRRDNARPASVTVIWQEHEPQTLPGLQLPAGTSTELFLRSGLVREIHVTVGDTDLYGG